MPRGRKWFLLLAAVACVFQAAYAWTDDPYHCAICGAQFDKHIYSIRDKVTHEKILICPECNKWPDECYLCGLPVRKDLTRLPDGRCICARDAKTVVLDPKEALQICAQVEDDLNHLFSRFTSFPGTNVEIRIVDRVDLLAFKVPGDDFACPNILGYYLPQTNGTGLTHAIRVMSALPRAEFKATFAHECTHAWVFANVPPERKKTLGHDAHEGFCELVAYLLMDEQNEEEQKKKMLRNLYTHGQIDLFIEAERRFGFEEILDWMKYGEDAQLDENDLSRVRNVEMPHPVSSPATNMVLYETKPSPVPDTLMLKGISSVRSNPLALVNDCTLAIGETGRVRVGETNMMIRCLAIGTNSIRIQIIGSGENRNLALQSRK